MHTKLHGARQWLPAVFTFSSFDKYRLPYHTMIQEMIVLFSSPRNFIDNYDNKNPKRRIPTFGLPSLRLATGATSLCTAAASLSLRAFESTGLRILSRSARSRSSSSAKKFSRRRLSTGPVCMRNLLLSLPLSYDERKNAS